MRVSNGRYVFPGGVVRVYKRPAARVRYYNARRPGTRRERRHQHQRRHLDSLTALALAEAMEDPNG